MLRPIFLAQNYKNQINYSQFLTSYSYLPWHIPYYNSADNPGAPRPFCDVTELVITPSHAEWWRPSFITQQVNHPIKAVLLVLWINNFILLPMRRMDNVPSICNKLILTGTMTKRTVESTTRWMVESSMHSFILEKQSSIPSSWGHYVTVL